jgi:pimeloyl-ACP methyl ester carboxylesterase
METLRSLKTQDGIAIHYQCHRAGDRSRPVLVLLHGMASNLTRWSEFVERTSLRERWDLIALDLRGHGESFTRKPIGIPIWCEDLVGILDAEGYDQAVVAGHSLGAQLALHFARRHPQRVRGVILIDPAFRKTLRGFMRWARWFKPLIRLVIFLVRTLNAVGLRRDHIPNRDLRRLDERTRETLLRSGKQKEMIERYSSPWPDLKHFPTAHFLQELVEMLRPLPPLEEIKVPVLVLLSTGLTYTQPEIMQQSIARFPNAQTVAIDAYHWPLTEKPIEVREAIERWLAQTFPSGA